MSYYHCGNGHHDVCNGYRGVFDDYTCLCSCHGEWNEQGRRVPLSTVSAADLLDPEPLAPVEAIKPDRTGSLRGRSIPRRGHGASEGDPSL